MGAYQHKDAEAIDEDHVDNICMGNLVLFPTASWARIPHCLCHRQFDHENGWG